MSDVNDNIVKILEKLDQLQSEMNYVHMGAKFDRSDLSCRLSYVSGNLKLMANAFMRMSPEQKSKAMIVEKTDHILLARAGDPQYVWSVEGKEFGVAKAGLVFDREVK